MHSNDTDFGRFGETGGRTPSVIGGRRSPLSNLTLAGAMDTASAAEIDERFGAAEKVTAGGHIERATMLGGEAAVLADLLRDGLRP
jgi:hypothetical protein